MAKAVNQPTKCPECTSQKVWKDGLRYPHNNAEPVQRFLCRSCGFRFSQSFTQRKIEFNVSRQITEVPNPENNLSNSRVLGRNSTVEKTANNFPFLRSEKTSPHFASNVTKSETLNSLRFKYSNAKVCVSLAEDMKNLAKAEFQIEKRAGGATKTKPASAETKGRIVEFLWWMKKEGYAESTITRRVRLLNTLSRRGADLLDSESIKLTIARQEGWNSTTKEHAVVAYTSFLKMLGETWKPPKYKRIRKLPFIPTEEEVNQLISGCNRKTSAFLKLLKETGMRSGEAWRLTWTDLNFENRTVSITPEKGGNPRVLGISSELIAMLKGLQKTPQKVFAGSLRHFRRSFRRQRKRIALKLQNARTNHITFHTLRHWKATMEYHRTKDILHVKQLLGHKNINSTLMYTQLISFKEDEFHARVAKNVEDACEMVEAGFQYVTGEYEDGGKIFRKRK